ncbi:hypothetical protein NOK12_30550 [Nocardioides sp. OK12]|uniref:serine/threonine-protein kinase n=1 Tax=Nocardioides sp. OK12 TaxID=2758661 RepID=UPI0021C2E592|nr:serine/threonine-protein kinase [Nocardioides sp. OK12]GHJ60537.1 hypothetical protein NOK12_30550 [Nocardioides sp. OK12]
MSQDAPTWDLHPGDQITPELTAVRLLGGGSTYEAYLAFDEVTYAPVVVKVVRPGRVDDASALRGLRREAQALAAVNHPVVVRGLRHEEEGPRPHLVLEHLDGPRLSTLLRRHGRLTEQQYLPLAIEVASALHYLRHVGWTHLDIKPSNIIMGAPARLIDLSVARPVDQARALTAVIGTDDHLSPEQADPSRGEGPGHASDVWGLCVTLFEAVAGHLPFDRPDRHGATPEERHPQLVQAPRPLPPRVPTEVEKVVLAGLEKRPEDRPLPHEVAQACEPVLARLPAPRLTGWRA